ncbi:chemotaxis protein CheA [Fluviispira sanaruensis]|uniref:Chemotaxis protein CheA n=1 Tax=Fluviispira sanaruensis TaxID=2493639 RepID=A0A4P2VTV0_FLUSA|nr:chemotaxis protein CheA [Fluviispira sanaruensis]BBH52845.1 hybrid sensor histidine kinase/response regulator [Fluviispira sanaruensis]
MNTIIEAQFIITFIEEALENLASWEATCLNINKSNEHESIAQLFRIAHNLKGSSASVGLNQLTDYIHKVEELLTSIKNDEIKFEAKILNLFFEIHSFTLEWILSIQDNSSYLHNNVNENINNILTFLKEKDASSIFSNGFEIFEEFTSTLKNEENYYISKQNETKKNDGEKNKKNCADEYLKVNVCKLDNLINYIGEVVIDQNILKQISQSNSLPQDVKNTISQMGKNIQELQDITLSLRMMSLEQQFQKMNRIVRDLSLKQQKKINFETFGSDVELDKVIVDKLTDPLTHLIRNAIDHGIESKEDRLNKNKPIECSIELRAMQEEGNVKILLKDDGKGLDETKILNKAIQKGIIEANNNLTKSEIQRLIFKPGFSTKDEVSDISGRGVGLDVVNNVISELKGSIDIETEIDKGTTFIISLPSSLSIIKGLIFKSNKQLFVIPESQIAEVVDHKKFKIETRLNGSEVFTLRNEIIPIISLNKLLHADEMEITFESENNGILIQHLGKRFSFQVEEIINTQTIVLKKLSQELIGIPGVIATTVLGNGEPALVLNLSQLVNIWSYHGTKL